MKRSIRVTLSKQQVKKEKKRGDGGNDTIKEIRSAFGVPKSLESESLVSRI